MVIKTTGVGEIAQGEHLQWEETWPEPLGILIFKGQQRQINSWGVLRRGKAEVKGRQHSKKGLLIYVRWCEGSKKMRTEKRLLDLDIKMVLASFLWTTSVEWWGWKLGSSGFRSKWEIRNLIDNSFKEFDNERKNRERAIMRRRYGIKEGVKYLYHFL